MAFTIPFEHLAKGKFALYSLVSLKHCFIQQYIFAAGRGNSGLFVLHFSPSKLNYKYFTLFINNIVQHLPIAMLKSPLNTMSFSRFKIKQQLTRCGTNFTIYNISCLNLTKVAVELPTPTKRCLEAEDLQQKAEQSLLETSSGQTKYFPALNLSASVMYYPTYLKSYSIFTTTQWHVEQQKHKQFISMPSLNY